MHAEQRIDLLVRVIEALRQKGVPFAVAGAAAMAVHGVSRSTFDIDLLVTDSRVLDHHEWQALSSAEIDMDIRRGDADDPLRGVVRITQIGQRPVDIIVGRFRWQSEAVAGAEERDLGPVRAPVLSRTALILTKLFAGGPQDLWDIEQLLSTGSGRGELDEVSRLVSGLPEDARTSWSEIRRRRGGP